jgi:hypothetical protein
MHRSLAPSIGFLFVLAAAAVRCGGSAFTGGDDQAVDGSLGGEAGQPDATSQDASTAPPDSGGNDATGSMDVQLADGGGPGRRDAGEGGKREDGGADAGGSDADLDASLDADAVNAADAGHDDGEKDVATEDATGGPDGAGDAACEVPCGDKCCLSTDRCCSLVAILGDGGTDRLYSCEATQACLVARPLRGGSGVQ